MAVSQRTVGVSAALTSALFLGLAPVFGKAAIVLGFSPLLVVAVRTVLASLLLFIMVLLFNRPFLYIYPAGLLGCSLAGAINGLGSVLYYLALGRLSASVGQLLYSLYPVFLATWLVFDHQPPGRLTYLRILLALLGVALVTRAHPAGLDWAGVALMLGASALYALHLPINQRVLFDIPAPTVTLYTLLAMSAVVVPAYLLFDRHLPAATVSWLPILGLTLVTFFSRLTLFLGVKHLGGLQTALLGLSELLVTLFVSMVWLHERLVIWQWVGAGLLAGSMLLIGFERIRPEYHGRALSWLRPGAPPPIIPWGPRD